MPTSSGLKSSYSSRLCRPSFFERPSTIGQAGYGPPDSGRRNPLPELLLESPAVLLQREVVVGFEVLGQPLFKHRPLPRGPAGDRQGLDTAPVSLRLFSQRFMVGIDTAEGPRDLLCDPCRRSTASSTLNLRSFEYAFMPGSIHEDQSMSNSLLVTSFML